jgi:hypothetical protein
MWTYPYKSIIIGRGVLPLIINESAAGCVIISFNIYHSALLILEFVLD